jgi:hypothetical protein
MSASSYSVRLIRSHGMVALIGADIRGRTERPDTRKGNVWTPGASSISLLE